MARKDQFDIPDPFFPIDSAEEKRTRRKSAALTAVIFGALLILFLFTALRSPKPDPGPMGIEIRLGQADMGYRSDEVGVPETATEEVPEEPVDADVADESQPEQTEADPVPDDQHAFDIDDAPSLDRHDPEQDESPAEQETTEQEQPEVDPDALYSGRDRDPAGEDDVLADAGESSGDEDSRSAEAGGQTLEDADGFSYDLGGRRMSKAPDIRDETQKRGTVVVEIRVNRDGKVVHARPGIRGSTTTDPQLYEIAAASARDTEFEADPSAPEEQRGTMVFIFRLE